MHGVAYLHIFVPTKKLKFKKSYPLCHCMKEWSLQQLDVSHHGDPIPVIGLQCPGCLIPNVYYRVSQPKAIYGQTIPKNIV